MPYDPIERGRYPVGVVSHVAKDPARDRDLPIEVWYPASDAHRGADLASESQDRFQVLPIAPPVSQMAVRDADPAAGRFPLLLFSHGFGGHRRQSTRLCSHLASHGYVVASVDHLGNTVVDMMELFQRTLAGEEGPSFEELVTDHASTRPADVRCMLDRVLAGEAGVAASSLDDRAIGMAGHSFGGWTTLVLCREEPRLRAALPLAPANEHNTLDAEASPLKDLDFDWGRDVPTLYLAAENDTLLPVEGMHELLARTCGTRALAVLARSDHMHFCDDVEQAHELFRNLGAMAFGGARGVENFDRVMASIRPIAELCSGEDAYAFAQGLGVAHFDRHLKGSHEASAWLDADVPGRYAERGIDVHWFE